MGRKIPAKKHRGVKNPLEQQARRERSLKSKINAPPKDGDDQPVPRSLTRLFAFQDKSDKKTKSIKKKISSNMRDEKGSGGKNPVCELKRLAGESGRSFSLRINGAVRALRDPSPSRQQHYPQDMEAEDVKGERMAEQRARRRRKRREKEARREPEAPRRPVPAPARDPPDVLYERVRFGEVAHAPPALAFKSAPRPGRRALLLTPLLAGVQRDRHAAVAAYRALNAARRHRTATTTGGPLNKLDT